MTRYTLLIIVAFSLAGCSSSPTPVASPAPAGPRPFLEIHAKAATELKSIAEKQNFGADWSVRLAVVWRPVPDIEVTVEKKPPGKDDHVYDADGIRVVMAKEQVVYLKGARVSYFTTPAGSGFNVTFPFRDEQDTELASEWFKSEQAKQKKESKKEPKKK